MTYFEYNEDPENLVEVDIVISDISCYVPCVNEEDRTIDFRSVNPGSTYLYELNKVRVPKEAITSRSSLNDYLGYKWYEGQYDIIDTGSADIWDKDPTDPYAGKFRFR